MPEAHNAITIDTDDNVYITGTTGLNLSFPNSSISTFNQPGLNLYYQPDNGSKAEGVAGRDAFILAFNIQNQRLWATHFGGEKGNGNSGDELAYAITAFENENLYLVGRSNGFFTPYECPNQVTGPPYCDNALNGSSDGFISRFSLASFMTNIEEGKSTSFNIFPNPVQDQLFVHFLVESFEPVSMSVYTLSGKLVSQKEVYPQSNIIHEELDVSRLTSGFYILLIHSSTFSHAEKIIK
jgi:hypothetical protein